MTATVVSIVRPADSDLREWDARVDAAEDDGIRARWEYGYALLQRRVGKQLPKGLLDEEVEKTGKSRQEIGYRMMFAERISPEEVSNVVGNFRSWHAIVNEALTKRDEPAAPPEVAARPLPDGVCRTIVADPPWQYGNTSTRGAAEDHYRTLSLAQLCGEAPLPDGGNLAEQVGARTADEAHLYLWTTNGFLREAFDVLDAWGFTYKTTLTWVKPQLGMGNYFRSSTEHVLFGVRGGMRTLDSNQINWFKEKRGRHSKKPAQFFELVEKVSPGPFLEMFAREHPLDRQHWAVWGNEV